MFDITRDRLKKAWADNGLALAATLTLFVVVWLNSFQGSLTLDARVSLSGYLGGDAAYRVAALGKWASADLATIAYAALLVDLFLFIPAYAAFFWRVSRTLAEELRCDGAPDDLLSLLHLLRGERTARFWTFLMQLLSLPFLLRLTTLVLVVVDVLEDSLGLILLGSPGSSLGSFLVFAHAAKDALVPCVLIVFLALLSMWLFNLGHPDRQSAAVICGASVRQRVFDRAVLRRDMADIVWRSRYSLFFIAFFATIAVVMNQGPDVLVGLTQPAGRSLIVNLGAILATIGAVWLFAFATYLWPRILLRTRRPSSSPALPSPAASQTMAKWCARLLGATPMLLLTILSGHAAQAAFSASAQAAASGAGVPLAGSSGFLILCCGLFSTLLGATFFGVRIFAGRKSRRGISGYFEVLDVPQARDEALRGDYTLLGVLRHATVTLIPLAFVAMVLLRLWGLQGTGAPLALAALALSLALWSGVVGQLSALALRQETPWLLFAIALSVVLGAAGLTDNHRVPVFQPGDAEMTLFGMSVAAFCLGLVLLAYGWGVLRLTRRGGPRRRLLHVLCFAAAAVGVAAVVMLASRNDAGPQGERAATAPEQPLESGPFDAALVAWLSNLCRVEPACAAGVASASPGSAGAPSVEAFVVSAEGGGIRAAYWTARALADLTARDKAGHFPERTFSISAVSGGSLGAATYRICLSRAAKSGATSSVELDFDKLDECIDRIGNADVLTPLLSSWLFEDVLSRLIPTSGCVTPGCGFMSRGLWFERALEAQFAAPESSPSDLSMRSAFNGLRDRPDPAAGFAPHLFLNSTVVESGERAIASDVKIHPQAFPDSRDQQLELGANLKFSTAAHNSARFTFVNAIGAVRNRQATADDSHCLYQKAAAGTSGKPSRSGSDGGKDCMHLADGGYFDNSGAQTTQDIVRALRRLLDAGPDPKLTAAQNATLSWMRSRLRLTGIYLTYGEQSSEEQVKCAPPAEAKSTAKAMGESTTAPRPATAAAVSTEASDASASDYNPNIPTCQGPLVLLSDLLGPLVTAKNAGGTGASGRLAESRLIRVIEDFNASPFQAPPGAAGPASGPALSSPGPTAGRPAVVAVELKQDAVLYPLGWYLSRQASCAMRQQAAGAVAEAAIPLKRPAAAQPSTPSMRCRRMWGA